jgi:hypothetical protein
MRRRPLLALLPLVLLIGCGGGGGATSGPSEQDRAVAEAMKAYQQAKASGKDLADGPCIAEQLPGLPDWVADIAHEPRQPADDDPANQCQRFRGGQAHHFVELDPTGQLIRAV